MSQSWIAVALSWTEDSQIHTMVGTGPTEHEAKEDLKNAIFKDAKDLVDRALSVEGEYKKEERKELIIEVTSAWWLGSCYRFSENPAPPREFDIELEVPDEYQNAPGVIM